MDDLISRQAAIEALSNGALINYQFAGHDDGLVKAIDVIKGLPSAEPEPLTDEEQRIFLAAMSREEKICRQTDEELEGPVNLVRICREIERKVKGALWGT